MLILISDAFAANLPDKLKKFGQVTDDKNKLSRADVILIRSKTKCTKEYIDSAPNLKLIIRGGVGLDNVDLDYAKSKGIQVYNTPAASSIAVAELAFAMMIAMPGNLVPAHNSMRQGKWMKKELKRTELFGKKLGVVGCGRIGLEVAKRAQAFGMRVYGFDIIEVDSDYIEEQLTLQKLVSICDYLTLHLPSSEETNGVINKELIAQMKDGIYIVNTGRGKLVVEEDVVQALESGKIAGYAADVYYQEPPEGSPLLKAPNVLLAPHLGSSSKENLLRIGDIIEKIVADFKS
ncbi:hydroxyacid dehydrogenase [candidate division KSB1 bacterium]|nr:hydroxyacid dehydrogenase [candidate division KSB1 bacterium]